MVNRWDEILNPSEISRFRALILQRIGEIEEEILQASDAKRTVELDQQKVGRLSRMDAIQQQAMAIASEQRRSVELDRLRAALIRMTDDEYGYCEDCGEPIAPKRLEIDLASTRCISCASG